MPVRYRRNTTAGGGGGPAPTVRWTAHGADEPMMLGTAALPDLLTMQQAAAELGVELSAVLIHTALNLGGQAQVPSFDLTQPVTCAPLRSLALSAPLAARTAAADITQLRFTCSQMMNTKDVWVPADAGCVDNANKDGQDLILETGASRKDVYIGFDLSALPSTATVISSTFRCYCRQIPTGGATVNSFQIADADEGWVETTLVCSNRPPADGASPQGMTIIGTVGEKAVTLNSTWVSRIAARIGVGPVTFLLQAGNTQVGQGILEAADQGTDDSRGPRLDITFTLPT
jgi:hypothetical protein